MNIQELTTYEVIDLIKQGRLPLYEVQEYINGKPQHGKEIEDEIIAEYLAAQAVGDDNAYLRQVYENLLLSQMSGTDEKENTKEQPQEEETSPTQPQDGTDEVVLPDELNTPRAQKTFANAIKAGYIERTATGYVWTNNKPSQLAYFLYVVYCPTQQEAYQETAFNKLFGVTRLLANLTQVLNAKQPQRWRQDIINLIE